MDSDQKNAYESYQHDLEEDLATKTTVEFARSITEQQLQEAATKGKTSGKELWEILMSDLSLKSLGELLTYEIWPRGKQLQEVMVESGYATKEELEEHVAAQATETSQLGEALVDRGVLTRAQLGQALMEQQRTGHDLSRVLLNLGYVTAKQVADATRADATGAQPQRRSERVADVLRENGMVNEDQLSQLLEEAERKGEDLAEFVIAQEIVTRD
ncbi:MAG: hypothetical protein HON70_32230, partial [Lentisphaerae bacterium]|nr:hypothetical protein [Lentisphaerota bacterium]